MHQSRTWYSCNVSLPFYKMKRFSVLVKKKCLYIEEMSTGSSLSVDVFLSSHCHTINCLILVVDNIYAKYTKYSNSFSYNISLKISFDRVCLNLYIWNLYGCFLQTKEEVLHRLSSYYPVGIHLWNVLIQRNNIYL